MAVIKIKNQSVFIDEEDLNKVEGYRWIIQYNQNTEIRYVRASVNKKAIYLHRLILNAKKGIQVDHINGNGLDNRKINLRVCTKAENLRNRKISKINKSGYKGVYWYRKKWRAEIKYNGEKYYIGTFANLIEAAKAYDAKAIKLHGEFARINK
ncbi:MAG: AP2 domain-containing protein [Dehalococcoidales bacterium]|nr:AP2 domain-containing protein [Dehalococcoidales bacterium]